MKNVIFIVLAIGMIGCWQADSKSDNNESDDTELTEINCGEDKIPTNECANRNLIEFTGDFSIIDGECIFNSTQTECSIEVGHLVDRDGVLIQEYLSDDKTCVITPNEDDKCWHPCDEVICDNPEPICTSSRRLQHKEGPGRCIESMDRVGSLQEIFCEYKTQEIEDCENSCVEVEDGPDYCL